MNSDEILIPIFGIMLPIIISLAAFIMIVYLRKFQNIERMSIIEKGLSPDLFPAAFSLARHAGWTAHVLEQAADNRLIRPDVRYVGPAERDLPA